jgi:hypothetical protein
MKSINVAFWKLASYPANKEKGTKRLLHASQENLLLFLRYMGRQKKLRAVSTSVTTTVPLQKGHRPGAFCVPSTFTFSPQIRTNDIPSLASLSLFLRKEELLFVGGAARIRELVVAIDL